MEYILLVVGFVLLVKGADFFVEGSSSVAKLLPRPTLPPHQTAWGYIPESGFCIHNTQRSHRSFSVSVCPLPLPDSPFSYFSGISLPQIPEFFHPLRSDRSRLSDSGNSSPGSGIHFFAKRQPFLPRNGCPLLSYSPIFQHSV